LLQQRSRRGLPLYTRNQEDFAGLSDMLEIVSVRSFGKHFGDFGIAQSELDARDTRLALAGFQPLHRRVVFLQRFVRNRGLERRGAVRAGNRVVPSGL
jgi:hypothetical protein